jgi:hypothetical protein
VKIHYTPNKPQKEYDIDLSTFLLLYAGGYGSGKSFALVMKHFKLHALNRPYPTGIFVPSVPEYKRDLLPMIHEILFQNNITNYGYHQTDKIWKFPWSSAPCHVITCEKRIKGPNLACASVNEPGLISEERVQEIIARVRVKKAPNPQINFAGTWEGTSNWMYEWFVENIEKPNRKVIQASTVLNQHNLREGYIDDLYANYDEQLAKAYVDGLPVNLNSKMFYYAFSREKNCDETLRRIPELKVYIGMDFNVDFMTATLWHLFDDAAHAFDEIVLPKNQNTQKLCDAIISRGFKPSDCIVFPDTSGKARHSSSLNDMTDIKILKNNNFTVKFKARAPGFRARQMTVNNMLDKSKIKVNPKKCRTLLRDLQDVQQDAADYSKIKDNIKLTHASDGMDYMIDLQFPISGKKPITSGSRF